MTKDQKSTEENCSDQVALKCYYLRNFDKNSIKKDF